LAQKWAAVWPDGNAVATFPVEKPRVAIDHVFTGRAANWTALRVVVGTAIFPEDAEWKEKLLKASDHVPVLVELELK
jgi:endonuclease/exonuclease/phosphatase family metal-dependent hydrolase